MKKFSSSDNNCLFCIIYNILNKFWGSDMTYPLGSAHLSTGKMHSIWILWEKNTALWEVVYYPLRKPHSILGEKDMAILW